MHTVLITDADRGLGRALAERYAADGWKVYAACRESGSAALPGVEVIECDLADPECGTRLAQRMGDTPLDVVIVNVETEWGSEPTVFDIDDDAWHKAIAENTYATAKVALVLRGNLKAGGEGRLVGLTDTKASIAGCKSAGSYSFLAARVGMHAIWRTFGVEWRDEGISCYLIGCDRDGSAGGHAPLAAAIRDRIAATGMEGSGRFLGTDGADIAW